MNKEYISACKLINLASLLLLVMCSHPLFLYGNENNELFTLLGILLYGVSLRCIGTPSDHLVRVK